MSDIIRSFIQRWQASGAAERANYQLFLTELCELIEVEPPRPKTPVESDNAYVFEKSVPLPSGNTGFVDLYKRGCFVLEAKQGSDKVDDAKSLSAAAVKRLQQRKRGTAVRGTGSWDTALEKAKRQAQRYARNLPPEELAEGGRPPFLLVVDVGHTIDLYAEFTRSGGHYAPFPDPTSYRITLDDLHDPDVLTLLRQVWTDPQELDPARRSARVTREIADRLARLAKSLEGKHEPQQVANFLIRALFTMFAEDVGLLPERSFTQLLADLRHDPKNFQPMIENLWETMNGGGFSVILRTQIPRFNGGLFQEVAALPLNREQIELLAEAAHADWRDVEPAIFGTLLERALDPVERHKLGAHYTPRAYVERLVEPTVMEPLRAEWEGVQAAALLLAEDGKEKRALAEVDSFLQRLATTRVLDPACGSGNFLYVTLAKMKELEAEVLDVRRKLGGMQMAFDIEGVRITPRQFLGIEVNTRAAAIAELVLWIGYLQWHMRTHGNTNVPDPVLEAYHNIECRDAVLAWDEVKPLLDAEGQPVTRWDGHTMKTHPVTGQLVPDETAQIPAYEYVNPRPAEWPQADYVVGNPPFVGNKRMRYILGDEYVQALRYCYPKVPDSSDYVMYWWHRAAIQLSSQRAERFGLITTNSLIQTFNRKILEFHFNSTPSLSIAFAVPDHPWVDDGASVRISMTIGVLGEINGQLLYVQKEDNAANIIDFEVQTGKIQPDLTIGPKVAAAIPLKANDGLCRQGCKLVGKGFQITLERREHFLTLSPDSEHHLPQYIAGRDITQLHNLRYVIDLFGYDENLSREKFPELMQHLTDYVLPFRSQVKRKAMREKWWVFGEPRSNLREALNGLSRYIITSEVSKHRIFTFIGWPQVLVDGSIMAIASDDALIFGIVSSRIHVTWALATGGRLGVGNDPRYNKTRCFEPFPFPTPTEDQKFHIRDLGEQLDAHRKRQQSLHPTLTLTNMYNVLEKLRAEEPLNAKEQLTHEQGLVSILKQLHDDLDRAVFAAYGWSPNLTDEEILERLVALNGERAAEEAQGLIRWLRPEYQAPDAAPVQPDLVTVADDKAPAAIVEKRAWPDALPEQAQAVRTILTALNAPAQARDVAIAFNGRATQKRLTNIGSLLDTLVALGQAEVIDESRYNVI